MSDRGSVVVIGESILDRDTLGRVARVCPDAPVPVVDVDDEVQRPGGAGLAAALLARATPTVLVTPMADDEPGCELRRLLEEAGVEVIGLPQTGATPVEAAGARRRSPGLPSRPRWPGRIRRRLPSGRSLRALRRAAAVLVSDYGRGLTHDAARAGGRRRSAGTGTPRLGPAPARGRADRGRDPRDAQRRGGPGPGHRDPSRRSPRRRGGGAAPAADELRRRWAAMGVAVTLGPDGALLVGPDAGPIAVPSERVVAGDSCGAGTRSRRRPRSRSVPAPSSPRRSSRRLRLRAASSPEARPGRSVPGRCRPSVPAARTSSTRSNGPAPSSGREGRGRRHLRLLRPAPCRPSPTAPPGAGPRGPPGGAASTRMRRSGD